MSRCRGRQSAKAVEQDFPHFVDIVVPPGGLGTKLDAMYEFHASAGMVDMMPVAASSVGASVIPP